jgi:hypothetical protein
MDDSHSRETRQAVEHEGVASDLEWLESLRFRLEAREVWRSVREEWAEARAAVERRLAPTR